ncbi:MAG: heme-dependent oxidative N-demethylase subunit alpha family protein [Nostocaceae cyanobacterium]|nr:heme-dependent oxidative N-demethylase subunit alpha family protein [Nostocaceae cyanobacterium]
MDSFLEEAKTVEMLDSAAYYFPLEKGRYQVEPGLIAFGTALGNKQADEQVFQIDGNFAHYRQMKLLARRERFNKYYQTCNYSQRVAGVIARWIVQRLTLEHPENFHTEILPNNEVLFHCCLTEETLYLDAEWQFKQVQNNKNPVVPAYTDSLDALAAQIQEDLVVVCRGGDGSNWVSAIHLCYPNHWAAEEKIGKDFAIVHAPVAGMEKINQRGRAIVNTMIDREPRIRFAWGLSTDTRLNHHPEPPPHVAINQWRGREFDPQNSSIYLRIERQVIWGFTEYKAAVFTIRTYFRDCTAIKQDSALRHKLYCAIASMTPESLSYKGLAKSKDSILAWLQDA